MGLRRRDWQHSNSRNPYWTEVATVAVLPVRSSQTHHPPITAESIPYLPIGWSSCCAAGHFAADPSSAHTAFLLLLCLFLLLDCIPYWTYFAAVAVLPVTSSQTHHPPITAEIITYLLYIGCGSCCAASHVVSDPSSSSSPPLPLPPPPL